MCLTVGINNSNTIIGYKLAFIRSRFGINVIDTGYYVCLHNIIGTQLAAEQKNLVNCIHTLNLIRSNNLYIDGLSNNDINYNFYFLHTRKGNNHAYIQSFNNTGPRIWNCLQKKINVLVPIAKLKKTSKVFFHEHILEFNYSK